MRAHPTRENARRRLQEAQRAEAVALADTTRAYAARARIQKRVDTADENIAAAVAKLAEVSGLDRAAQLLDQPLGVVKRAVSSSERNRTRGDTEPEPSP